MGDLIELARQLVAHPGWRVLAGMVMLETGGDSATAMYGSSVRVVRDRASRPGEIPDLRDPLTALGLLVIAREVWGNPDLYVEAGVDDGLWVAWICGDDEPCQIAHTEVEALARAILAAPVRGGA